MSTDEYRRIALIYDLVLEPLNKGLRGLGMKYVPGKKGEKVLDVCCGTGVHLGMYQENGCEVHGVDLSPAMLKRAERRLGKSARLSLSDATALPYDENSFDTVLCMLALHEMWPKDRLSVVKEMNRVVKPGGRLLLIDFHPGPFVGFKGKLANAVITMAEFLAGKIHFANSRQFLKTDGLSGLIKETGLTIVKERVVGGGTFAVVVAKNGES